MKTQRRQRLFCQRVFPGRYAQRWLGGSDGFNTPEDAEEALPQVEEALAQPVPVPWEQSPAWKAPIASNEEKSVECSVPKPESDPRAHGPWRA